MNRSTTTAALAVLVVVLAACGPDRPGTRDDATSDTGQASGDVVHLVDRFEDVVAVEGPLLRPLMPEPILWPLENGRVLGDGFVCHELPWPALTATSVMVHDGDEPRRAVLDRGQLTDDRFLFVPARRRVDADSMVGSRQGDQGERISLRRRRTSVHQASQVLFRSGQRGEVPIELTGEPVVVRVRARPEGLVASRLELLLDGEPVGDTVFRQRPFEVFEWNLGERTGSRLLQIQAHRDGPDEPAQKFLFAVQWLEVISGQADRVLVSDRVRAGRVEYPGRPPAPVETLVAGVSRPQQLCVPLIGGPVEIQVSASPTSLWVRSGREDQQVALPDADTDVMGLEVPAGLGCLNFDESVTGAIVRQGTAALLPFVLNDDLRLDDDLSPIFHADPTLQKAGRRLCSRLEIQGDRRAALLLPTPTRVALEIEWQAGDRLRFSVGRAEIPVQWQLDPAIVDDAPVASAQLEIRFTPEGGAPVTLERWTSTTHGPWQDREFVVPPGAAGRGVLEFVTDCDSPWACVPMACADPRIVPPVDRLKARPNLILYLVDTLRADRLSCYDGPNPTSPSLDRVAAGGFLFESFRAVASWTRPTTATAMTGLYPSYHGILADDCALPKDLVTLAEVLRAAGYSTWAGVTNIQVSAPGVHFEQGFHRFATPSSFGIDNPQVQIEPSSRLLAVGMLPWLQAHQDEPFFLYLHSMDPHIPYLPPADFKDRYTNGYDGVFADVNLVGVGDLWRPIQQMTDPDVDYLRNVYDAEVRCQDDQIGALDELLRDTGRHEDSLWVILSDHGEEFFEHQKFTHAGRMWEELLHVPLVLQVPPAMRESHGLRTGRIATPVSQVDLFPSLLELLDVETTVVHQGQSFVPQMRGEGLPQPRLQYSHENEHLGALVHGEHKLIWRPSESDPAQSEWLLFHLGEDRGEQVNLADQEPDRLQRMIQLKSALEAELGKGGALTPRRADSITFDAATIEHLKALGYLGE